MNLRNNIKMSNIHLFRTLGEEKTRQLVDLMNETLHIIEKGEENEY